LKQFFLGTTKFGGHKKIWKVSESPWLRACTVLSTFTSQASQGKASLPDTSTLQPLTNLRKSRQENYKQSIALISTIDFAHLVHLLIAINQEAPVRSKLLHSSTKKSTK